MCSRFNFYQASYTIHVTEEDILFILPFTGPVDGEKTLANVSDTILHVQTALQTYSINTSRPCVLQLVVKGEMIRGTKQL